MDDVALLEQRLANPSPGHVEAIRSQITELGELISSNEDRQMTIYVSMAESSGYLSPDLFLFQVQELEQDLLPTDAWTVGVVHVSLVVNGPASLIVEAFLDWLMQLLSRREMVGAAMANGASYLDLETAAGSADTHAHAEAVDALQNGWRSAARLVQSRSSQAGISLKLMFEDEPVCSPAQAERIGTLCDWAYNSCAVVRGAVDGAVNMIASNPWKIHGSALPASMARELEASMSILEIERFFAHASRDALVRGNGFLAFNQLEPIGAYCLDPTKVEIAGNDTFRVMNSSGRAEEVLDPVLHQRGLEYFGTRVGHSVLLPLIPQIARARAAKFVLAATNTIDMDQVEAGPVRTKLLAQEGVFEHLVDELDRDVARLLPVLDRMRRSDQRELYLSAHVDL